MRALIALELDAEAPLLVDRAIPWIARFGGHIDLCTIRPPGGMASVGSSPESGFGGTAPQDQQWEKAQLESLLVVST